MKLFADKTSLRQRWKYRAKGGIWRIYPTGTDLLFGEDRDVGNKKALFFSLNRETGEQFWAGEKVHEWWVGVEGVIGETLFLHGFATPDMPIHRGIVAVDGQSGKTIWENPECCFEYGTMNGVVASRGAAGSKTMYILKTGTGEVINEWKEGSDVDPGLPYTLPEGTIRYPDLETDPGRLRFGRLFTSSGPCSVLERGGHLILSYREEPEQGQEIAILDAGSGASLYRDQIASDTGPFRPDSFLVQEGMLYYVRDGKQLIAVQLPSEQE